MNRKVKIEMSDLDKLFTLYPADSISVIDDKKCFEKEFNEMSLEEQFERELIDEKTYDSEVELRTLKERGII